MSKRRRKRNVYRHNPERDRLLHALLISIKGMSTKDIAMQTGVSPATIYNWRRLKNSPSSRSFNMIIVGLGKRVRIEDE